METQSRLSMVSQPLNLEFPNDPESYHPYFIIWKYLGIGILSVESQPQDLEFRNNPENFNACYFEDSALILFLETTNQQTF